MNEEYLTGLHEYLNIDDDYNTWVNAIQGNTEYLTGLHEYLKIEDDYGTWSQAIFGSNEVEVKKKEDGESVLVDGSLVLPTDNTRVQVQEIPKDLVQIEERKEAISNIQEPENIPTTSAMELEIAQPPTEEDNIAEGEDLLSKFKEFKEKDGKFRNVKSPDEFEGDEAFAREGSKSSILDSGVPMYRDKEGNKYKESDLKDNFSQEEFDEMVSNGEFILTDKGVEGGYNEFERNISNIDADLIDMEQEFIVPQLNYQLGQYGFIFEEVGGLSDYIKVTSEKTGDSKTYGVDDILGYSQDNKVAVQLKDFLRENKIDITPLDEAYDYQTRILNKQEIKKSVILLNKEIESFQKNEARLLEENVRLRLLDEEFNKRYTNEEILNNKELRNKRELLNTSIKDLYKEYMSHSGDRKYFKDRNAEFDRITGKYFAMQAEQGSMLSGIGTKLVIGAAANTTKAIARTFINLAYEAETAIQEVPKGKIAQFVKDYIKTEKIDMPEGLSDEEVIQFIKDYDTVKKQEPRYSKDGAMSYDNEVISYPTYEKILSSKKDEDLKKTYYGNPRYRNRLSTTAYNTDVSMGVIDAIDEGVRELYTTGNATDQWIKLTQEDFWGGAFLGLAESIPAMMAGAGPVGTAQRLAQMYALSTEHVYTEMEEDASFDDITEDEKYYVTAPIGIAVGALETIGFRNIVNQKGLLIPLVKRALGRSTSRTTAKTFGEFIRQDVKSLAAQGALIMTAGGLAEFETGFAQQYAEVLIKDVYNDSKDKKMFKTPDTWGELFFDALRAGGQEMVGGIVISSIPATANLMFGTSPVSELDTETWNIFKSISEDGNYLNIYKSTLKEKVLGKEITEEEAQESIAKAERVLGLMPQIPAELNENNQKKILQLLIEKNEIESKSTSEIPLSKENKERVKLIKNEIDTIISLESASKEATDNIEDGIQDFNKEESKSEDSTTTDEDLDDITDMFSDEKSDDIESVSNNIKINKKGKFKHSDKQKRLRNFSILLAKRGIKSISKILPDTKIVLHESNDEYLKYAKLGDGRGEFNSTDNVIHINLSKATKTTVPHEIFHAVFLDKLKTNPLAEAMALKMMTSVRKTLDNDSDIAIRIDALAKLYVKEDAEGNPILDKDGNTQALGTQNEERLAELAAILATEYTQLTKPAKNKVIEFIRNFAKRFNITLPEKYFGSEFGKNDDDVIDLLNTLSRKLGKGDVITTEDVEYLEVEPGKEAVEITVDPDAPMNPQPRQSKDIYDDIPFTENLPVVTLRDFINRVNGRVFAVTSDATKVGFDSKGDRIDGGFGYSAIIENIKNLIGFASLDFKTAKGTIGKIRERYKTGEKIGVIIMVQNPSATVGNYYGGKYLGRGLLTLKNESPDSYQEIIDGFIELLKNKSIAEEMNKKDANKKALIDLISNPENFNESEFAAEWIKDTTFEARRKIMESLLIFSDDISTNKKTNPTKLKLKEAGFNTLDFLMEYGDVKLIGENNIKNNNGGFAVGGFEMIVPKNSTESATAAGDRGFVHPQFNGKIPSNGNNFIFDGLYPMNENFLEFATPETKIADEFKDIGDERIRKTFKEDVAYDKKFLTVKQFRETLLRKDGTISEKNLVRLENFKKSFNKKDVVKKKDRGYSQLKSAKKTQFKEANPDILIESDPNIAANVARGMGFSPDAKTPITEDAEFKSNSRQQKDVEDLTEGTMTTTTPVKIYKGIGGKMDIFGQRINAHKGVKGIFSAIDKKLAEEYGRKEGVAEIDLPAGVTIEVVEVNTKGLDPKQYRAAEVKAINESDAQVVKLITIEGRVKGLFRKGKGKQQQYVIKDFDLVPELKAQKPTTRQQRTERLAPNGKRSNLTDVQYDTVRTKAFKNWFGNWETDPANASKVVDENGEPMVMYHGTPDGEFDVFREESYFTASKEYAENYQETYASTAPSSMKEKTSPKVFEVFLNFRNLFDTRIEKNKNIFNKEYYRQWGMGTPLMEESGLPDWNDGRDLLEWIDETDQKFDGIMLDEGASPDMVAEGKTRAPSYVPVEPNQIKLADGSNKTFDPDAPSIRQQKPIPELINEARENNFKDKTIRDYLVRVLNKNKKAVDDALEVSLDMFKKLPDSFKNMIGGIKEGQELYRKIEKERKRLQVRNKRSKRKTPKQIDNLVKDLKKELSTTYDTTKEIDEKVKTYKEGLQKRNKKNKNKKSTNEINELVRKKRDDLTRKRDKARDEVNKKLEDFEEKEIRLNNKRAPILSKQEIMTALIEFMETQPEYIAESDTKSKRISLQQAQMAIDLQSNMDIRPTEEMHSKIKAARLLVKDRIKGMKDLQSVKRGMRNFIRKSLPKELYTLKETMDLINKITLAEEGNILGLMKEVESFVISKNINRLNASIDEKLEADYTVSKTGRKKGNVVDLETKEQIEGIYKSIQVFRKKIKENTEKIKIKVSEYKSKQDDSLSKKERDKDLREYKLQLEEEANSILFTEIINANAALQIRFKELSEKTFPSFKDLTEQADIQLIIELNNSLLMENTESKLDSLDKVNSTLQQLVFFGRSTLQEQLKDIKEEADRQFEIAYEEITGNPIDMKLADARKKLRQYQSEKTNQGSMRGKRPISDAIKNTYKKVSAIVSTLEGIDGLMDKISSLPGVMFGGNLQDLVTDKVDESSRNFKRRRMFVDYLIQGKLEEIYGKNWAKKSRENRKPSVQITINADEIKKAREEHTQFPTKKNYEALELAISKNSRMFSQNQLYYLYNQSRDDANDASFVNMYGQEVINKDDSVVEKTRKQELNEANTKRVIKDITDALTPKVKEFADWQVNSFFPEVYETYNDVYKKMYQTNMPWNENYAGRIFREGITAEPLDILAGPKNLFNNSVSGTSTLSRVTNDKKIKEMDGTDALMSYVTDMEYFTAFAETVRDINKIFTNKYIKSAIESRYGAKVNTLIENAIQKIANRGVRTEAMASVVNGMNNVFILGRLGFSPVIYIKQLTSMFTYANDIGIANWTKYSVKSISQLKSVWKEIRENSVYMQDRKYDGIMKAMETYSEKSMKEFIPRPTKDFFVNASMFLIKEGDRSAIFLGGTPNYLFYKDQYLKNKPNATEQETIDFAIRKFEADTKRTQQSSDLQDKDITQTSNPYQRAANMFLTTPRQYLRKEIQATRSLFRKIKSWDKNAGKGSAVQNIRTLAMYHVFMPVLFQYVTLGFPGLLRPVREDDDDEIGRAAIIGNLNGIFILGELIVAINDYFGEKPWAGQNEKTLGLILLGNSIIKELAAADKLVDPVKKEAKMKKIFLKTIELTGIPASNLNKIGVNYEKVISGDTEDLGETILRLLTYSDYAINGPRKKKKKSKTVKQLNEEYFKRNK